MSKNEKSSQRKGFQRLKSEESDDQKINEKGPEMESLDHTENHPLIGDDHSDHQAESKPDANNIGDGVVSSGGGRLRSKRREMATKQSERKFNQRDDHHSSDNNQASPEHKGDPVLERANIQSSPPKRAPQSCCFPFFKFVADSFDYFGYGYRNSTSASQRLIDWEAWERLKESPDYHCIREARLSVLIGGLSDLQGVLGKAVKPFIKIHAVNITSGHYISSSDKSLPPQVPLSTRQAYLKGSAFDLAQWNEELIFHQLQFCDLVTPDSLLLFEILDDPPSLSFRLSTNQSDHVESVKKYNKLAWAFLLPVGQTVNVGIRRSKKPNKKSSKSDLNSETISPLSDEVSNEYQGDFDMPLRLQLYQYQFDTMVTELQRAVNLWPPSLPSRDQMKSESPHRYPDNIPEVYLQYRRKTLIPLTTMIDIRTGFRIPTLDSDAHQGSPVRMNHGDLDPTPKTSQVTEDLNNARLKAAIMKRTRAPKEPCVLPNRVLHRINAGTNGAMVVSFSTTGLFLAVACLSTDGNKTIAAFSPMGTTSPFSGDLWAIKIYDPDTSQELWAEYAAHYGVIYDLRWSSDDSYLLSCSSDGQSKIWKYTETHNGSPRRRKSSVAVPSLFQLLHIHRHSPPVYIYAAIFHECGFPVNSSSPRVLTGSHDGRIRVWSGSDFLGDLLIGSDSSTQHQKSSKDNRNHTPDFAEIPHLGYMVQALAIDPRSRYLYSGDSEGSILMWRPDGSNWYQLLRRFKKDDLYGRSISSLSVYPDRAKGYLLVLALPCLREGKNGNGEITSSLSSSILKLYDLGSYRAVHTFHGATLSTSFCRASFSADGRYVVCPCIDKTPEGKERFHVRAWDSQSGHIQDTFLNANIPYPYLPRCVSWHPSQHMIAIAMVGTGAAIGLYCAHKARGDLAAHRLELTSGTDYIPDENIDENSSSSKLNLSSKVTPSERIHKINAKLRAKKNGDAPDSPLKSPVRPNNRATGSDQSTYDADKLKEKRTARTMEILEKIKAAKAKKVSNSDSPSESK